MSPASRILSTRHRKRADRRRRRLSDSRCAETKLPAFVLRASSVTLRTPFTSSDGCPTAPGPRSDRGLGRVSRMTDSSTLLTWLLPDGPRSTRPRAVGMMEDSGPKRARTRSWWVLLRRVHGARREPGDRGADRAEVHALYRAIPCPDRTYPLWLTKKPRPSPYFEGESLRPSTA